MRFFLNEPIKDTENVHHKRYNPPNTTSTTTQHIYIRIQEFLSIVSYKKTFKFLITTK